MLTDSLGAPGQPKRMLAAALVAVVTMIAGSLLVQLFGAQLNREIASPLGALPLADVLGVLLAMAAGGAVAGHRAFRWIAVLLQLVVWAAIIATLYLAYDGSPVSSLPLAAVLRHNALALTASLVAAGLGAWIGERLAQRRRATPR
ncbi:hypothetical protein ACFFGH_00070 [Lysobacter korlensis]|uniref:Uncharacterized protein n=1 Tax=Lysobacter korlensis TaxID=553636 RepID=A0ABV6RIQ4_9GAMM